MFGLDESLRPTPGGVRARTYDRGAVRRRPPRHRRQGDAGDPRLPEAGDRRDQRTRRRHRRHDDPGDGPPAGLDQGADRLRLRPARHRARGRVDVVPPADRGRPAGTGVDLLRRDPDRRAGPRGPAGRGRCTSPTTCCPPPRHWPARSSSDRSPVALGAGQAAGLPQQLRRRIRSRRTWRTRWRCSTPRSATARRAWRPSCEKREPRFTGTASELPEIFPSRRD